jgi:hypothetical protein
MSGYYEVEVSLRMEPAEKLPIVKPLTAGWGPVIRFHDQYFPGRVMKCSEPIEPGQTGKALIGVMMTKQRLDVGSVFELRDGWTTLIATATALSVREA